MEQLRLDRTTGAPTTASTPTTTTTDASPLLSSAVDSLPSSVATRAPQPKRGVGGGKRKHEYVGVYGYLVSGVLCCVLSVLSVFVWYVHICMRCFDWSDLCTTHALTMYPHHTHPPPPPTEKQLWLASMPLNTYGGSSMGGTSKQWWSQNNRYQLNVGGPLVCLMWRVRIAAPKHMHPRWDGDVVYVLFCGSDV